MKPKWVEVVDTESGTCTYLMNMPYGVIVRVCNSMQFISQVHFKDGEFVELTKEDKDPGQASNDTCAYCGKEIGWEQSMMRDGGRTYCSLGCSKRAQDGVL